MLSGCEDSGVSEGSVLVVDFLDVVVVVLLDFLDVVVVVLELPVVVVEADFLVVVDVVVVVVELDF